MTSKARRAAMPILPTSDTMTDLIVRPNTNFDVVEDSNQPIEIKTLIAAYEQQSTVMEADRGKTVFAMRLVEDLHQQGQLTKDQAFRFLMTLDDSVQYTDWLQDIYEAAERQQLIMFVDQIHKLHALGAAKIAMEVNRSVYNPVAKPTIDQPIPTPSTPRPRGIIARMLFGDE